MARITKEERLKREDMINHAIFELFLDEGYGSLSMKNVAYRAGIRQSTLQSYHSLETLHNALIGRVSPYFYSKLLLDSVDDLNASWKLALEDSGFRNILSLLVGHIAESDKVGGLAYKGLMGLMDAVQTKLGDEGIETLYNLMGRSVIQIALKKGSA
ncbi:hypothetical protein NU768_000849 [Vibrio vulnificus]|nr:hypothetical protein [Vibrio vulnificus]